MEVDTEQRGRLFGWSDGMMLGLLVAWLIRVLLAAGWVEEVAGRTLPYLTFPLVLGAGIVLGRLCARRDEGQFVHAYAAALALFVLIAPCYPNAQAAVGVQLVAVAGLMLSKGATVSSRPVASVRLILGMVVGILGVLLAARARAASILVVVIGALVAVAVRCGMQISRRIVVGIGLIGVCIAGLVVVGLGNQPVWPRWLGGDGGLSQARHYLWRDAQQLWKLNPIVGGGPGSFYEFSDTARSEDHLYAAHSSILQVAAELGAIGVVLFLAVLVAGAVVASQGDPARGLIGVAAWCALAVHSMIDHLYEFPLVCLLAGVVIGWSGARPVGRSTAPTA